MSEKEYILKVLCIKDMWSRKFEKLYNYFGSAKGILIASEEELINAGMTKEDAENILDKNNIERKYEKVISIMNKDNIGFVTFNDDIFPKKLLDIDRPVYYLFFRGRLPSNNEIICSIVGARNCTEYGKSKAQEVAENLASNGISVVSGMARGIDKMAHLGAIYGKGRTYAILGCGVDICYPPENIEVYEMIRENGGVISEYIPGSSSLAWRFPDRNRIISGLADCVAVIEAGRKSGSLITASLALQMGRDIFALPGRVDDRQSMGCNELIRDGAGVIFDGFEICESMGFSKMKKNKMKSTKQTLEKDYLKVYSCTTLYPKNVETIVRETNINVDTVRLILIELEMMNLVKEISKDYYVIYQ